MVRLHVVRASHIAYVLIALVLLIALVVFLANGSDAPEENPTNNDFPGYVYMEAEAADVSASAVFREPDGYSMWAEVIEQPKKDIRILIYHTHTHEAYCQEENNEYVETSLWRTKDNLYNIVRVGEALSELLTDKGFTVIHDTTDHEKNDLSTAYTRSLETLEGYTGKIDVYIDMHRDAYHENGSGKPFSLKTEDVDTARLMFLVGNGEGFMEKPYYRENYELATLLTGALNEALEGICRPVMVKDGRYNQHISDKALLVEVGHNENSLQQALNAMPYLADALEEVLSGL